MRATHLIVSGGGPAGNLCGIRDAVLQAVGSEGSETDGGGAEDGTDSPKGLAAHCLCFLGGGIGVGIS